jgi:hypothetical protein
VNQFAALRTVANSFMVDTCRITDDVAPVFDPDEGYTDETGATFYTGPCRVRPAGGPRVVNVGEDVFSLRMFDVWLPWDTTGVELDHLLTVTTSDDPYLVGRVLRVVDVQGGSDSAHRKLLCEDTLTVTGEEVGS